MDNLKIILFSILFLYSSVASSFTTSHNKFISYSDMGQGKPLVLIHAFPTEQRLWLPQQEGLQSNFRVITLDLWGFGLSTAVDGQAITMSDYADEVKQLLDQLNISKAIIAGESMGGYVALAFLKKYPDQTLGLILANTQAIADNAETKAKREATAIDILQHGTTQFIQGFMTKALSPEASTHTRQFLQKIVEQQPTTAMASALRGMALRDDLSYVLKETNIPILIITSDQDVLIDPKQSEIMHELAKNSNLIVLTHAGHVSNLEQPELWNKAVLENFCK